MGDISSALVNAINSHQDKVVSGLMGIGGTIVGAMVGLATEQWRQRGKVTPEIRAVIKRGASSWAEAEQLECQFHLRFLNSYPVDKSMTLETAEFFKERPRKGVKPDYTATRPLIGYDDKSADDQDIVLPSRTFARVYIVFATPLFSADRMPKPEIARSLRFVRVVLRIAPDKTLPIVYDLNDAYDFENNEHTNILWHKGLLR